MTKKIGFFIRRYRWYRKYWYILVFWKMTDKEEIYLERIDSHIVQKSSVCMDLVYDQYIDQ